MIRLKLKLFLCKLKTKRKIIIIIPKIILHIDALHRCGGLVGGEAIIDLDTTENSTLKCGQLLLLIPSSNTPSSLQTYLIK